MWRYAKRSGTILVFALLLLVGSRNSRPTQAGAAATLRTFHQTACPLPLPANQQAGVTVTCGYVVVPEDRTQPNGSTVALATMIYKSTAGHPDPVPLLYLQGGPGSVALAPFASGIYDDMVTAVIASRDMVVFDQRGNGASLPSLACPEVYNVEATQPDVPIQDPEQLEPRPTNEAMAVQAGRRPSMDALLKLAERVDGARNTQVCNPHSRRKVKTRNTNFGNRLQHDSDRRRRPPQVDRRVARCRMSCGCAESEVKLSLFSSACRPGAGALRHSTRGERHPCGTDCRYVSSDPTGFRTFLHTQHYPRDGTVSFSGLD